MPDSHPRSADERRPRLLAVGDGKPVSGLGRGLFASRGYDISTALSQAEALSLIRKRPFDMALVELRRPDSGRGTLLRELSSVDPGMPIVVLNAKGDLSSAVQVIREGAYDVLTASATAQEVLQTVCRALGEGDGKADPAGRQEGWRDEVSRRLGAGPAMQRVYEKMARFARSAASVLIVGEHGTGRALVAQMLHSLSARRDRPFLSASGMESSSISLSSTLLGWANESSHDPGTPRPGILEAARGGTVYLSHVDQMPPPLQRGVAEAIRRGSIRRIGSRQDARIDARLICSVGLSSHPDRKVQSLQADLWERLRNAILVLPALRERPHEIPPLAFHLLGRLCVGSNIPPRRLSPSAEALLIEHSWPGNLIELEAVLERALITSSGRLILPRDLSLGGFSGERGQPLRAGDPAPEEMPRPRTAAEKSRQDSH